MKLLAGLVMSLAMACTGNDSAATPDAMIDAAAPADAATCAPRMCGTGPMPYHVDVTHNADGTVTMSRDDYGKVQAFLDRTLLWESCETH